MKKKEVIFKTDFTITGQCEVSYVKDHSNMASLVNVVESSMGPRREPLTIHTTTAGNVEVGPFQIKLDGLKQLLESEV